MRRAGPRVCPVRGEERKAAFSMHRNDRVSAFLVRALMSGSFIPAGPFTGVRTP
jgi:hypothetical protein